MKDQKKIFKEYKKTKELLEALTEKKVALELQIIDLLDDDGVKTRETEYGRFSIMGRDTYTYSEKVGEKAEELKKMKKVEELTGVAVLKSSSQHVRFIPA